jgi:hypothetical protein
MWRASRYGPPLAVFLALTAPAHADPRMSVTLDPVSLRLPGAASMTYRVAITTTDTAERFAVQFAADTLPDGGAAMAPVGDPALTGPGRVLGGSAGTATPACSPTHNRFHGYEPETTTVDVEIPSHTATVLVARYAVGAFTPWPGAPLGVAVQARRRLSDGSRGTLSRARRRLRVPRPQLELRRTGVRLRLWTRPRSDPTAAASHGARIRRGRAIVVHGSTRPALAHVRIRLAVVRPGSSRLRTLARVRTDRRGRFRYGAWRPRRLGRYELWAFYASQRRDTVSDHRCPRGLRVIAP